MLSLGIILTACSSYDPLSPITVKWENGQVISGGDPVSVSNYTGANAEVTMPLQGKDIIFRLSLDTAAKDVSNIAVNTQGITTDNMGKMAGCYYYSEYLGSVVTVVKEVIPQQAYQVCQCGVTGIDENLVYKTATDLVNNLQLTTSTLNVDVGPFTVLGNYGNPQVRSDAVVIPGVIKVTAGTKGCTEPITISIDEKNTKELMCTTTEKYVYYDYEGFIIQTSTGINLADYIDFK